LVRVPARASSRVLAMCGEGASCASRRCAAFGALPIYSHRSFLAESRIDAKGESSMRTRIVAVAVVMTVTLTAVPSFAHHSDVAYDQTKRTMIEVAKVLIYAY